MKPYLKYKDTGIEGIGSIPEHWAKKRIKFITGLYGRIGWRGLSTDDYVDDGVVLLGVRNISERNKLFLEDITRIPVEKYDESPEIKIRIGDVLLAKTGATIGKSCVIDYLSEPMTVNAAVNIFRPCKTTNSSYLNWLISSYPTQEQIWLGVSENARGNLFQRDIKEILVVLPPLSEQQAIANYLDRKTHLIDTFIENKQKLIDLLKEQRAAIINQAVTKGLNPDVKLKDSGIEWLGEIPEHWGLRKVGRSFNLIGSGTTPKSENIGYYENGTINWVITGDLNDGILDKTSKKITEKALDEYSTLKIYPVGTLLIAMYGATIGKISLMNFEGCVNQACCALSDSPYLSNGFSFYWFLANKQHIINMSFGGGQPNISQEVVRTLKIPTPPSSEQQAIIYHLDGQTTRIDKIMEKQGRQIELLKEYRTALISEVVTGKIDVRDSEKQEVRPS